MSSLAPSLAGPARATAAAVDMPPLQTVLAADGVPLGVRVWERPPHEGPRPVVLVCPATSVACRWYTRFARYLHRSGLQVLLFDYRGIGSSRPPRLRGFRASAIDWGCTDLEAVIGHARQRFPGAPLHAVGHSVGGLVLGLAPSSHRFERVFTVGAQYGYWPDYEARQRLRMALQWHVFTPLLTALCGWFPGRRLGWMEDTPAGVVRDWGLRSARFEQRCHSALRPLDAAARQALVQRLAALRAPTLALSFTDDAFATVPAVERLLAYYVNAPRSHLRLDPSQIGVGAVGHFDFFHDRHAPLLWPLAAAWLAGEDATAQAQQLIEPGWRGTGWLRRG